VVRLALQAATGQAQDPRSAPTGTCTQASRRQQGADPQEAGR